MAVELRAGDRRLLIAFLASGADCGKPRRADVGPIAVSPGDVARVRFNGRFSSHDLTWYEDAAVGVAYDVEPTRELFLARAPIDVIDARVDL